MFTLSSYTHFSGFWFSWFAVRIRITPGLPGTAHPLPDITHHALLLPWLPDRPATAPTFLLHTVRLRSFLLSPTFSLLRTPFLYRFCLHWFAGLAAVPHHGVFKHRLLLHTPSATSRFGCWTPHGLRLPLAASCCITRRHAVRCRTTLALAFRLAARLSGRARFALPLLMPRASCFLMLLTYIIALRHSRAAPWTAGLLAARLHFARLALPPARACVCLLASRLRSMPEPFSCHNHTLHLYASPYATHVRTLWPHLAVDTAS